MNLIGNIDRDLLEGDISRRYCCFRSNLCISHCKKLLPGQSYECFGDFCMHIISLEKLNPIFSSFDPCPSILRRQATMSLIRRQQHLNISMRAN